MFMVNLDIIRSTDDKNVKINKGYKKCLIALPKQNLVIICENLIAHLTLAIPTSSFPNV